MHPAIAQKLLELNRKFYADFGEQFSATRQRIQPGVRNIIATCAKTENILDLGCGNAELARVLVESGFKGTYTGLDFSLPLLQEARLQPPNSTVNFLAADLSLSDWERILEPAKYSLITAFAVLHHIPGQELRIKILQKVHHLLKPGGRFIHSNWQFLNSPKLKQRIQPWEKVGLSAEQVDLDDYLLDWRAGGSALRYAHHFSTPELARLAAQTGFLVKESYLSDGQGNRLGLYQVWDS